MTALATSLTTRARLAVVVLTIGVLSGSLLQERATRLQHRRAAGDAGFTTIEWVVIALGLFLIAGIAVAAITGAVNTRLNQIT
jgi:hypothetical protein